MDLAGLQNLMDKEELAWAAGLFEGEGSICRMSGRRTLSLTVTNSDLPRLERFNQAVGGGGVLRPLTGGRMRKPVWNLTWSNQDGVLTVTALLWPRLGEAKRAQVTRELLKVRLSSNELVSLMKFGNIKAMRGV